MAVHQAIQNLRLVSAFKCYHPDITSLIDSSTDSFVYVVDDEAMKVSRLASKEEGETYGFIAENACNTPMFLLPIDHKLLDSLPGGVTDCALFDEKTFAFIEFKTNASGNSSNSIEYTYNKAVSQIENTLAVFKSCMANAHLDFLKTIRVMAFVVVSPMFPRANATEQSLTVDFATRTGLELSFDPNHKFS